MVSTRRQRFTYFNVVRTSKDSVVFCGDQKPSNVTSPGNEMWVRFKSRYGGRRGFKAWFGAEGKLISRPLSNSFFRFCWFLRGNKLLENNSGAKKRQGRE